MHGKKPLARPSDVVYLYDGSFEGFLCCVYKSVYSHQIPAAIWVEHQAQPTLFEQIFIQTELEKAKRVLVSIPEKISSRALELIKRGYLTAAKEKELVMLRFLLQGYRQGAAVVDMFGHPDVAPLLAAEKHLMGEQHLLLGFVRFSDYGGVLVSTISPKNFVLPLIAGHFMSRYSGEEFVIFDKAHGAALVYKNKRSEIVSVDGLNLPPPDETEENYRKLWKQFYKTIAIEERINHRCRQTHMPKRYWENMLEVQELLG